MVYPKSILKGYVLKEDVEITLASATEFWLSNEQGDSYYLKWWGNGWVIKVQDSYLCKNKSFKYFEDIPSFKYSHHGDAKDWEHIFDTKEDAVEFFRKRNFTPHDESEEFYGRVYDILVNIGGAPNDSYREAFLFNYSDKEKFPTKEWRFQGKLGFGGKYRTETNQVDCYQEDETPEKLKILEEINTALKNLKIHYK